MPLLSLIDRLGLPSRRLPALAWAGYLLAASGASLFAGSLSAPTTHPQGYFVMRSTVDSSTIAPSSSVQEVLSNSAEIPNLSGALLRETWRQLNPSQGVYDWTYFDNQLSLLQSAGKSAELEVYAGGATPSWVYGATGGNAKSFNFNDPTFGAQKMPIPWDTHFQSDWNTFVQAFGARYDSNPAVTLVHLSGPTRLTPEMYLPTEITAQTGYSTAALQGAWNTTIQSFNSAFPHTALALDLSHPFDTGNSIDVAQSAANTAVTLLGSRATLQQDSLSATTSSSYNIQSLLLGYQHQGVRIGYETVSASNDPRYGGPFLNGIAIAHNSGAQYVSIYTPDWMSLQAPYVVPEPSSVVLSGAALATLAAAGAWSRQKAARQPR